MYPAPIEDYLAPKTLAEVFKALAQHGEEAHCIAGGQSLMQALKSRLLQASCLIDLQHVSELKGVTVSGGMIRIGAMTRYCDIEADERLRGPYEALIDAASHVGDRQVRNRGTIGGSLCWNYIAACMPPTAIGIDAQLELERSGGKRRMLSAEAFIGSPMETAREAGEILVAIQLPAIKAKAGSAYKKWGLLTDSLPIIGVCAAVHLSASGGCESARIAVGGLGTGPRRAKSAEAALKGVKSGDEGAIAAAAQAAAREITTQKDIWADEAYRKQLVNVIGAQVIQTAFARAV